MLQQTTVNACIPYYERWMRQYPSVLDVAKAPLSKVLKSWQGLGYYQRARNIHAASKILVKEFNAKIPKNPLELKKLPGFGPYTVGAVLSIAYDIKIPIIDANVRRVFMRILAIKGIANTSVDDKVLNYLNQVLPEKNLRTFNQALMELGALVCRNHSPQCLVCPVKDFCKAYQKGIQEIIPEPKKTVYQTFAVVLGIIKQKDKFFIQQRSSRGLLAGLWEFPGGKVKARESKVAALKRELKEECAVEVTSAKHFMDTVHFYTNNRVKLHVFFCQVKTFPKCDPTHKWLTLKQIKKFPMPSGSARIIEKIKRKPSAELIISPNPFFLRNKL